MVAALEEVRHDLPPLWDGTPVKWDKWCSATSTLILHVPADQMACDQCGAIDEPYISWGARETDIPRGWIRDMYAARCRHCWHDVVTDTRTNQRWDLDETDYGPDGSASDGLW